MFLALPETTQAEQRQTALSVGAYQLALVQGMLLRVDLRALIFIMALLLGS